MRTDLQGSAIVKAPSRAQRLLVVALAAISIAVLMVLSGCGSSQSASTQTGTGAGDASISVYSREDGSGTRSAFVELFGIEEKDASGNKVDMTTPNAAITNSTAVMMTSVAGDENAIGYISLGSLNDTVKALEIDGVQATTDNVKSGAYKISRPFNIVMGNDLSDAAQDFLDFIMSADGQKVVEDNHYIAIDDAAPAYASAGASGKVVVAGSSSVTPVMEKLAEAYAQANPNVTVEVQQSDSTTGVNMVIEGTCDLGMASRDLKDSETSSGARSEGIALEGIAVIVSPKAGITGISSEDVKRIYTGEIAGWGQIGQ